MECIFCKIINREIPANILYEDDNVIAFLDAFPKSKGHTLVVPKKHFDNIHNIDESTLSEVIKVTKLVAGRIKDVLNPTGITILQNNGESAGQSVFHIHFHIIPVYEQEPNYTDEEVLRLININTYTNE